jgi:hypothetical protein
MGLRDLPRIDRLRLAELVLPAFHPESATDPVAVVAAQSAWRVSEFETGNPSAGNVSEELWSAGSDSLRRLRSVDPAVAYFSHDETTYRRR